jgi:PAS domain-containing protein
LKATKRRIIGAHFSEFIPPDRLKDAETAFTALRTGGSTRWTFRFEGWMAALDGSIVELAWTSSSYYLPGLYFCSCRDITRRKRAEEALRRSEHELRFVLDHMPALIAYVDTSGRYVRVNRAYEELLSQPAKVFKAGASRTCLARIGSIGSVPVSNVCWTARTCLSNGA